MPALPSNRTWDHTLHAMMLHLKKRALKDELACKTKNQGTNKQDLVDIVEKHDEKSKQCGDKVIMIEQMAVDLDKHRSELIVLKRVERELGRRRQQQQEAYDSEQRIINQEKRQLEKVESGLDFAVTFHGKDGSTTAKDKNQYKKNKKKQTMIVVKASNVLPPNDNIFQTFMSQSQPLSDRIIIQRLKVALEEQLIVLIFFPDWISIVNY